MGSRVVSPFENESMPCGRSVQRLLHYLMLPLTSIWLCIQAAMGRGKAQSGGGSSLAGSALRPPTPLGSGASGETGGGGTGGVTGGGGGGGGGSHLSDLMQTRKGRMETWIVLELCDLGSLQVLYTWPSRQNTKNQGCSPGTCNSCCSWLFSSVAMATLHLPVCTTGSHPESQRRRHGAEACCMLSALAAAESAVLHQLLYGAV